MQLAALLLIVTISGSIDGSRHRVRSLLESAATELEDAAHSPNAAHWTNEEEELIAPHLYAECCPLAAEPRCRRSCLEALEAPGLTLSTLADAVLDSGCDLLLHDSLWLCLASQSSSRGRSGVGQGEQGGRPGAALDSARLHCCSLARSPACRRVCQRAFQDDWSVAGSGGALKDCVGRGNETMLASCLEEVDEPCLPGCSGLDFCSGVLEGDELWFRSCSALADRASRQAALRWWQDGVLVVPDGGGARVPLVRGVRGARACSPGLWRALACLLHARPCSPRTGSLPLCLQDCLRLLPGCVLWSAVQPGFSAAQLCARLAAPPPCAALPPWVEDEPEVQASAVEREPEVEASAVEADAEEGNSTQCQLGAASDVTVEVGTAVRVPAEGSCYSACMCTQQDGLQCVPLPCPSLSGQCSLGTTTIEHRRTTVLECMVCSCSAGDLVCTQRTQPSCPAAPPPPCRCPSHHVPVCGSNGRTFHNACLARCAGLAEVEVVPGSCALLDPCSATPCKGRCVPDRKLCLSLHVAPCLQHQCVDLEAECASSSSSSSSSSRSSQVCDTLGHSHSSLCALLQAQRTLLYRGACAPHTDSRQVCGADGNTYPSRAAARAALVPVAYPLRVASGGSCSECDPEACDPLPEGCLRGVRPWGACCPVCGGVLHATLHVKALDRAALAASRLARPWPGMHRAFSLQALLQQLQLQVLVADCEVLGYLVHSDQLVVLVLPLGEPPAVLRCFQEAQRLAGLFEQSAARLQSHLLLSSVLAVDLLPAPEVVAAPDAAPRAHHPSASALLLVVLASALAVSH